MEKRNQCREPAPGPLAGQRTYSSRPAKRRVSSADLLGARRELLIEHRDEVYVLRHTSKGKLILTK